jgi:plasmid stabilization system protein ParE
MRLRWTPAAEAALEHISNYLREHHPHYRQFTVRKIYEAARLLKDFPHRRRPGREEGTRELRFPPLPCIVVYRMKEHVIEVLVFIIPRKTAPKIEAHVVSRTPRDKAD